MELKEKQQGKNLLWVGSQATRLFGKAPAKFHTLEYGAQGLEDPQVEVPKELQEGPPPLHDSHMQGVAAVDEAAQEQARLQEEEGPAKQPEIQEGQEVGQLLESSNVSFCTTLCYAVHCKTLNNAKP